MTATLRKAIVGVGAIVVTLYSVLPFIWLLIASITPEVQTDAAAQWSSVRAVQYFPAHPSLENYAALFRDTPFGAYMANSIIVSLATTIFATALATLGAYGFVRFRFVGRSFVLVLILVSYMIPSVVLLVPLLIIFRHFGLIDTYLGLVLAESKLTTPFALLLMINYISGIPREIEESAQIDGCGRLATLVRIILPLSVPGLLASGLYVFISTWNHFLFAYVLTTSDKVKTLPVIIRLFALGEPAVWGVSAAGAVLTTLPVAVLFLFFQRMMIGGLAMGAIKG